VIGFVQYYVFKGGLTFLTLLRLVLVSIDVVIMLVAGFLSLRYFAKKKKKKLPSRKQLLLTYVTLFIVGVIVLYFFLYPAYIP